MNYKKTIFIILFLAIGIMLLLLGSTYAYYTFGIGNDSNFSSNTISDINISYEQGQYITTSLIPLSDNYVSSYANKYNFSIIVDKKYNNYEIGFLTSLININYDEVFNNWLDHVNYQILDENNNIISHGNFKDIKEDKKLSLNSNMIVLDTNYSDINNKCYNKDKCKYKYILKLWIKDICLDSNDIKTCPNYNEQYKSYEKENCVLKNENYDCSLATNSFIYDNSQNVLQDKKISMNIKIDTGLRK